eukprot:SAG22_NODE_552_length_9177_cov_15.661489_6_plen_173_part_00
MAAPPPQMPTMLPPANRMQPPPGAAAAPPGKSKTAGPSNGAAAGGRPSSVDSASIEKMKVSDLRAKMQANGLLTDGKKSDLVQRYVAHLDSAAKSARGSASGSGSDSSRNKRKRPLEEPDTSLVLEVRSYMKANKLSQVMVGQEARVSQAVISQWLSLKYHGHNSKVSRNLP